MPDEQKTVFISYRRSVAPFIARAIFLDLRANGYDVFMDEESINSENFKPINLHQIEARAHFLLILTPGTFKRYIRRTDMLCREIHFALFKQRNVVPLLINDFDFNDDPLKYFERDLKDLPLLNSLNLSPDNFEAAMAALQNEFLKQPLNGTLKPAPALEVLFLEKQIETTSAQPAPTPEQLHAEAYFSRAYQKHDRGDRLGAFDDFTEAIRIHPTYALAYDHRGTARSRTTDPDGVLADYTEAIRLNPLADESYFHRGELYLDVAMKNHDAAFADFTEAIRLHTQIAEVYMYRGDIYREKGNLDAALVDYTEAILINSPHANPFSDHTYIASRAYSDRAYIHYFKGRFEEAIADWSEAHNIRPLLPSPVYNQGEAYFANGQFDQALAAFRQADKIKANLNETLSGLAITQYRLDQKDEAERLWRTLIAKDQRFRDADWVGKELNWRPELIEAARQLIAEL